MATGLADGQPSAGHQNARVTIENSRGFVQSQTNTEKIREDSGQTP